MAKQKMYTLPEGKYNENFIKAVACAIHKKVLAPEELTYMLDQGTSQYDIAIELLARVRPQEEDPEFGK